MVEGMASYLVAGRVPALGECRIAVLDSGEPCPLGLAAIVVSRAQQFQGYLVRRGLDGVIKGESDELRCIGGENATGWVERWAHASRWFAICGVADNGTDGQHQ